MIKANNQKGFTLIELMASMVILSVIIAVASKRFIEMQDLAETTAAIEVCHELNGRESGIWAGTLISGNYKTDTDVFVQLGGHLNDLNWVNLTPTGGTVVVNGQVFALSRQPSQLTTSARWSYGTDT